MKKRKKQTCKGFLLLAVLLLFMISNIGTKAAEESNSTAELGMLQVTIEEADISLLLPENCYLLEQNIAENDPYLKKVGGDREKIQNYYKEAGIVLNAIAEDDSYEIVVTMNESSNVDYVYNMQSLTEEQIIEFADTIQATYASYGYTVEGYELYETEHASYVLFCFGQLYKEQKVQCSQYYTIRDSKIFNITLRSYRGEITAEMKAMMGQVIDSIVFSESNQEIIYENEENGVSFQLPYGWTKVVENPEDQYVQAQYMHTNGLGESMQFFCMDLWGNMDSLHQLTNTREELTMREGLVAADKKKYKPYVSGFFDKYEEVFFEKIGDSWYLTSEVPMRVESESIEGVYLQKSVITIQNGVLYAYQYGYYEDGNLHETDFEEFIKNITYQSPKMLLEDGQHYKNIAGMLYKMTAVAIFIIMALAGVMYLYFKEPEEQKL